MRGSDTNDYDDEQNLMMPSALAFATNGGDSWDPTEDELVYNHTDNAKRAIAFPAPINPTHEKRTAKRAYEPQDNKV